MPAVGFVPVLLAVDFALVSPAVGFAFVHAVGFALSVLLRVMPGSCPSRRPRTELLLRELLSPSPPRTALRMGTLIH